MLHDLSYLSHTSWECKYHVIFIPKYRKKVIYGMVRTKLVEIFRRLVKEKGVEILEGNLRKDHVHMVLSIPPKYSISMIIGFLKGKSAILIHRELGETKHGLYGKNFWARGYFVSSIGADEEVVKEYVRKQEYIEKRNPTQQLDLGLG